MAGAAWRPTDHPPSRNQALDEQNMRSYQILMIQVYPKPWNESMPARFAGEMGGSSYRGRDCWQASAEPRLGNPETPAQCRMAESRNTGV
jgi:hypothetical protein